MTLDFRHPQAAVLDQVDRQVRSIVEQECRSADIQGQVKQIWYMPPVFFAEECIKAVQSAANRLNCSSKSMISGAGHDAMYLAKVTPTGMIFVPCKDGLSHNELEYTAPEDLVDGCNVLLYTVLELANS
jgi:N-carbamoyl-L-amino-acid hydrolase